jgi:hypothetical protein
MNASAGRISVWLLACLLPTLLPGCHLLQNGKERELTTYFSMVSDGCTVKIERHIFQDDASMEGDARRDQRFLIEQPGLGVPNE